MHNCGSQECRNEELEGRGDEVDRREAGEGNEGKQMGEKENYCL
jgi:hypothetical protein